jgi:hypothetical protein
MSVRQTLELFMNQTLQNLRVNMNTQAVWPREVYAGYSTINENRRLRGQWYSTGNAAKSFQAFIQNPDDLEDMVMTFTQPDYLRYVDLGVGQGTHAEDVDRDAKASYKRRYTTSWNRRKGKSHRPIMMEYRHLARRLANYALDWYGEELTFGPFKALPEEVPMF